MGLVFQQAKGKTTAALELNFLWDARFYAGLLGQWNQQ